MISEKIRSSMNNASWIRAMFEEGKKLTEKFGVENVFDFTLGNPDPNPPDNLKKSIYSIVENDNGSVHKYMHNAGFEDVRKCLASKVSLENDCTFESSDIIMTCGAAGGLNIVLKSILNTDDEVIIFSPFFVEYLFYIENHGGKGVISKTNVDTFFPQLDILANQITSKTKAIILNSPNNPTGVVYDEELLIDLSRLIESKERDYNSDIYIISDEPYSKIVYENYKLPSIAKIFNKSFTVTSFSKSHSLAGERIGFVTINAPKHYKSELGNALTFTNRILGFVNAPSLFQKVIADIYDFGVDTSIYAERRDLFYNSLVEMGYTVVKPLGAFYLFPKSPIEDDTMFCRLALEKNLLLVPGTGFGTPGYFRISYCKDIETIRKSLPIFKELIDNV